MFLSVFVCIMLVLFRTHITVSFFVCTRLVILSCLVFSLFSLYVCTQSLTENKLMKNFLMGGLCFLAVLVLELIPELNESLELVPMPSPDFSVSLFMMLALEIGGSVIYAKIVEAVFDRIE